MVDPLRLYHGMLRIRRVEEALARRYAEQEMRCPMHLCIGQEATAVGVAAAMEVSDQVFSGHRAHGHYLAKGGDLRAMVAELYGRDTGCCRGRGGSMHLIDRDAGFMGSTPIVGGTVPLAVGAAWSARLQDNSKVVAVFFGDGCFEEGVLHESMNFASLHKLPVIFVCENNGYSVYTSLGERQPVRPISGVAGAHGLRTRIVDGNDVRAVHAEAVAAVEAARHGAGPQFLELATYRWLEHCGPNDDNDLGYRPAGELQQWQARCPVATEQGRLLAEGVSDAASLQAMENTIHNEIEETFAYAIASPLPVPRDIGRFLHA
jgi:pyruvate dehydrogenase E1 component alpha subunit